MSNPKASATNKIMSTLLKSQEPAAQPQEPEATQAANPVVPVQEEPKKSAKAALISAIVESGADRLVPVEPPQMPPDSISKLAQSMAKTIMDDPDAVAVYVANIDLNLGQTNTHPQGASIQSGSIVTEILLSSVILPDGKTQLERLIELQKAGFPSLSQIGSVSIPQYQKVGEAGVVKQYSSRVTVDV